MTDKTRLKHVFATALAIPIEEINDALTYNEDKRWDSTAHMILIAQLEAEFELMMDIDDIIDMSSYLKAKQILNKYNADLRF
jgi:acyl carrier protein